MFFLNTVDVANKITKKDNGDDDDDDDAPDIGGASFDEDFDHVDSVDVDNVGIADGAGGR